MKNPIHLSCRSEARGANARSIICHRRGAWPALLLVGCCAVLTGLAQPARAAVIEAWVQCKNHGYANAVAVDGSGNVVVTGGFATIKYLADGTEVWTNTGATFLALDRSGNAVVTGSSYFTNGFEIYTAKYAAVDGALLWEKRYHGPANDFARAVAVDGAGNVVVTGVSDNGTNSDYYTAKYAAADGALLWEKRYNGPANSYDQAEAVALDGSGDVVVTGGSSNGTNENYYTAKYAAVDGGLLWEKRYSGPANSEDRAQAVAVDGSRNVVVTGYSDFDYYTAKYAAADGALLWEKRYNGTGDVSASAKAVAVDGSGNVVVTGSSGADSYTAKYAATDGALLWEKRHNGPANFYNYPSAVAVDGSGNVVVTGSASNGPPNLDDDYYTAKYAAADGALLWEKRYNGPASGDDYATSLALGPNGMVAVTGISYRGYATVVYWENLPPVSIERVPAGIRLRFTGFPGRSYNIERASAVPGPWTNLATPTAPPDGLIEYVDTDAPAAAFYRTSTP